MTAKPAFDLYGAPACWVNFPNFTTTDIQVSVQYLVYGLREMHRRAGRKLAVFGISQGGLMPRVALTYWPSLRTKVGDVVAIAGTQHGTTVGATECRLCVCRLLAAGARVPLPARAQCPSRRDAGAGLVDHAALGDRRGGAADDRTPSDLGAEGGDEHPHSGRLPGTRGDPSRHRAGLGQLRGRGRRRAPRPPARSRDCPPPTSARTATRRGSTSSPRPTSSRPAARWRPTAAPTSRACGAKTRLAPWARRR